MGWRIFPQDWFGGNLYSYFYSSFLIRQIIFCIIFSTYIACSIHLWIFSFIRLIFKWIEHATLVEYAEKNTK